jgi:hypothetical protein
MLGAGAFSVHGGFVQHLFEVVPEPTGGGIATAHVIVGVVNVVRARAGAGSVGRGGLL